MFFRCLLSGVFMCVIRVVISVLIWVMVGISELKGEVDFIGELMIRLVCLCSGEV